MSLKSGEVSWGDTSVGSGKKTGSKDTFLRLGPGSNIVRLLTLPHQYHQHKYLPPGGKKFGYRVNCAGGKGTCSLCDKNDNPKRRWFLGVIDRKTNAYKILDIGYSVFKDIQTLAKDDDWGDPSRYDIDIVVDPNGGATNYYTVVAKPPKPLSASDLLIKDQNCNPEELTRMATPPTSEKVSERLKKIAEEIGGVNGSSNHTLENEVSDDEDDDDYFKDVDAGKRA